LQAFLASGPPESVPNFSDNTKSSESQPIVLIGQWFHRPSRLVWMFLHFRPTLSSSREQPQPHVSTSPEPHQHNESRPRTRGAMCQRLFILISSQLTTSSRSHSVPLFHHHDSIRKLSTSSNLTHGSTNPPTVDMPVPAINSGEPQAPTRALPQLRINQPLRMQHPLPLNHSASSPVAKSN
jgi:hypothetical protein